jgi:arginyl-tRNA synthetase
MNVHALVLGRIVGALEALVGEGALPAGLDLGGIEVAPPRIAARGDLSSNAALVLAKTARMKPREIAARLAEKLRLHPDTETVEVAGAGFLNLRFAPRFWQSVVAAILKEGSAYGRADLGRGERVNVAYVSSAVTGPLHVGHGRAAVLGDAIANLLTCVGYEVTREYDLAESGAQALARSGVLVAIKQDLAALDVRHDVLSLDRSLTAGDDEIRATVDELRKQGLAYPGRLPEPKGHGDGEWEDREQTLLKSTAFGDHADCALLKSDGSYTSFAAEVAGYRNKLARGFRHLIEVRDADRPGDVAGMRAAVTALSEGKVDLDIKVCRRVKLLRAGRPVGPSTPKGAPQGADVTLRDVVDGVGRDAARFALLYRPNDAPLDLDLAKVADQSKDNPVFYVQYAHARAKSIFRNAQEVFPELQEGAAGVVGSDLSLLSDPGEINLIRKLAQLPTLVEGAARARDPHRLAVYLYDLASCFDGQYTLGNDLPHLRFIRPWDGTLTAARLALVQAVAQVLAVGLELLGVLAPLEMR